MKAKAVPIGLLVAALFAGGIGAGVSQFPKARAATPAQAAVQAIRALRQHALTVRSLQDYYAAVELKA